MKHWSLCCTFFLCLSHASLYPVGLAIAPMEQHIQGAKAATYTVSNQEEKAIAVEVIVESWTISEDGEEIRAPSSDLVAYPRQFILKGSTYKKIKVGRKDPRAPIDVERAYRVTIRELPISLEPEEPGTYHVYRASAYRTSYYLQPKKPRPDIKLERARLEDSILTVTLRNEGNAHIHLRNPVIALHYSNGTTEELRDLDALSSLAGENMHAQISRSFSIDLGPWQNRALELTSATLRFEDQGLLEPNRYELEL